MYLLVLLLGDIKSWIETILLLLAVIMVWPVVF